MAGLLAPVQLFVLSFRPSTSLSPPLRLLHSMKHFQGKYTHCLIFTQANINRLRYSHGSRCEKNSLFSAPFPDRVHLGHSNTLTGFHMIITSHSDMYCALFSTACFALPFYHSIGGAGAVVLIMYRKTLCSCVSARLQQRHRKTLLHFAAN